MSALATQPLRPLPLAAGLFGIASLGSALLLGPGGTGVPSIALGIVALGLLLTETARRTRQLLRSGMAGQVVLGVLTTSIVALGWWFVVEAHLEFVAISGVLLLSGAGLTVIGLVRVAADLRTGLTPWQALTGGPTPAAEARQRFQRLGPLLAGILLLMLALRAFSQFFFDFLNDPSGALALLLMLVLFVVLVGPLWALRGVLAELAGSRTGAAGGRRAGHVQRDEQVVAAHLHDSVLQTLSLIQRNAADPARVAQLARQQERSLRAWLAGRDDATSSTLAGAVRLAAQEVEDEQPGAVIEVVAVGDAPLDREADAMVRAAREAMRNAVRHAGSPVRVFIEVEDGVRELFVRDTGPGFDLDGVADERRGVRDAIIGRMEHVGGTATIDSTGSGTEIGLKLPPPTGGGSR